MFFAPKHRTIDDALPSYERTMLERERGAIAEATTDYLTLPPVGSPTRR